MHKNPDTWRYFSIYSSGIATRDPLQHGVLERVRQYLTDFDLSGERFTRHWLAVTPLAARGRRRPRTVPRRLTSSSAWRWYALTSVSRGFGRSRTGKRLTAFVFEDSTPLAIFRTTNSSLSSSYCGTENGSGRSRTTDLVLVRDAS